MPSPSLPDVAFGEADAPKLDWRKERDDDEDPDDEEFLETPEDVHELLGFDPLDPDEAQDAEFEETEHPRGAPGTSKGGQFVKKGQEGGAGAAEVPAPPAIQSQGKLKHLNAIHALAKAGKWEDVEAYPAPAYAKTLQKYKAKLLAAKPKGEKGPSAETGAPIGHVYPPDHIDEILPSQETVKWKNGSAIRWYAGDPGTGLKESLVIGVDPNNKGQWQLWTAEGGVVATGSGQQSLNDAFEKLHPRGKGGQFVEKPEAPEPQVSAVPSFYQNYLFKHGLSEVAEGNAGSKLFYPPEGGLAVLVYPPEAAGENSKWEITAQGVPKPIKGESLSALQMALPAAMVPQSPVMPPPNAGGYGLSAPAVDPAGMQQVGPQLGSNPGGQYEDADGKRYYVKKAQSEDHARNELLAARLYGLANSPILVYRQSTDPRDVVTQWDNVEAKPPYKWESTQRDEARQQFAVHAWLANWDVVGLDNDNMGLIGGVPTALDLGGALAYRAKGTEKGSAFGDKVDEWDTLRNPAKNYNAAALFGTMSDDELKSSAKLLESISAQQISDEIDKAGYTPAEAAELSGKLIERRLDILKRAKDLGKPPPPAAPKPISDYAGYTPKPVKEIEGLIESKQYNAAYHALEAYAPKITDQQKLALSQYKGSSYQTMNDCMREHDDCTDARVTHLTEWLSQAKTPMPLQLWRRLKGPFATAMYSIGTKGMRWQERGFVSTSLDPTPMKGWGTVEMEIDVPAGMPGTTVNNSGESEVLFNRGVHFKILEFDRAKKYMRCEMQSGEELT